MAYEKRLCLLKQIKRGFSADGAPLTGAVYAERLGEELTVTPRIAGLTPLKEGRYALAVGIGGQCFCLGLRGNEPLRVPGAPSLNGGFAALLCYVREGAEAIAFGHCGTASPDYRALLSAFAEPSAQPRETAAAETREAKETKREEAPPFRETPASCDTGSGKYDDEAIASTDYYGEAPPSANEEPAATGEPSEGDGVRQNEAALHPFRLARGGTAYYNEISAKLKTAFEKYPRDERLSAAIPHSEWVKTEQALLGIVYAEGTPRFLCVALEKEPPDEARDACAFVPFSPYSDEEGLFVVFQDADTGEYVKVEQS